MRSPISVWRRMNAHSLVVERAGLVQDRVGDRDLADVVQLAAPGARSRARSASRPRRSADRGARALHALDVLVQAGVALVERLHQRARGLAARAHAAAAPCPRTCARRRAAARRWRRRPRREQDEPVRGADLEALAPSSRARTRRARRRRPVLAGVAVDAARRTRRRPCGRRARAPSTARAAPPRRAQQRVAGGVAEGVVVVLEAVEVVERERAAGVRAGRDRARLEVAHQPAAVAAGRSARRSSPRAGRGAASARSRAASARSGRARRRARCRRGRARAGSRPSASR